MSFYLNPAYIYYKVYDWFSVLINFSLSSQTILWLNIFWFSFGIIFFILFIFILNKKLALDKIRRENLEESVRSSLVETDTKEETAWGKITHYLNSANPSDWKLAILEADTMLDAMVLGMGYRGENLGERLKTVEPSDFNTLNDAWEAHKIRNQIAHEGAFEISHKEAVRVLGLYEKVFKEFGYI
ncbi:MAG: hypothetical protein WDZ73_01350 [Candidatus Paceibacterota bacterium]